MLTEGCPRWREFRRLDGITSSVVMLATYHQHSSVEILAQYLNKHGFPGILRSFAEEFVGSFRPFVAELLPREWTEEARKQFDQLLADPLHPNPGDKRSLVFTSRKGAIVFGMNYFTSQFDPSCGQYFGFQALLLLGVQRYFEAVSTATFAVKIREHLPNHRHPILETFRFPADLNLKTESVKADILARLITQRLSQRRHQHKRS